MMRTAFGIGWGFIDVANALNAMTGLASRTGLRPVRGENP